MFSKKAEEYMKRQRALGYEPSLAGMDEEDFDYVPSWANRPPSEQLNKEYKPVDRDFAERMFKMFRRPFDRNWEMPNLDGPEYIKSSDTSPRYDGNQAAYMPTSGMGQDYTGQKVDGSVVNSATFGPGGMDDGRADVKLASQMPSVKEFAGFGEGE